MASRNEPPRWAVTTIMPALGGASRISCHSSAVKSDFEVIAKSPISSNRHLRLLHSTVASVHRRGRSRSAARPHGAHPRTVNEVPPSGDLGRGSLQRGERVLGHVREGGSIRGRRSRLDRSTVDGRRPRGVGQGPSSNSYRKATFDQETSGRETTTTSQTAPGLGLSEGRSDSGPAGGCRGPSRTPGTIVEDLCTSRSLTSVEAATLLGV